MKKTNERKKRIEKKFQQTRRQDYYFHVQKYSNLKTGNEEKLNNHRTYFLYTTIRFGKRERDAQINKNKNGSLITAITAAAQFVNINFVIF